MNLSTVSGHSLAEHFRSLGCQINKKTLNFKVQRLSHVEDGRPGTLSWFRSGFLPADFRGDVLVANTKMKADGMANLVAYHDNPRMVLRKTIMTYGFGTWGIPRIAQGPRCKVHPSAVLGADGQSYDLEDGQWVPFPHAGRLRLGSDVEVGPCATLMRGSIGDTIIGNGSKIGNGVNVGHDTRIGQRVLVIAGAMIAGWVRIGNGAKIWQGAILKNGVRIGEGAQVGMGAVVLTDVPPGEVWAGNPARLVRGGVR